MPDVGVVIPAYNRATTLHRALGSALSQSVRDIEVLVVDDGSTDGTAEVATAARDPRVRVLCHATNRGAAAARNTAVAACRAPFIAFLDSDDAWLPGKLEAQLATLRAAPANTLVSCHGVEMRLVDHGLTRGHRLSGSADWFARLLRDCDFSPGATLLARREAFDIVGPLDETLPRFEDWDWLLRYAMTGRGICIPPGLLAVVWNRRGRLGEQHELSARRFLAKHAALYAALPWAIRRAAVCDIWLQVAGTYAFQRRPLDAGRVAVNALAQRPLHGAARVLRHAAARAAARLGLGGALLQPGRAAP